MENPKPIHVLLVDDNPANLVAMSAAIDGMDVVVITAGSGEEALRCLLRYEFAVILMDIQMPGMDGFETAEIIRQRRRTGDTPIIFITAISQADTHMARGYALGAVDYVFKPVPLEVLRMKVAVFVDLELKRQIIARQSERIDQVEARGRQLQGAVVSVARELRAPLRALREIGQGLLAAQEHGPSPADRGALDQLLEITARMSDLVRDLSVPGADPPADAQRPPEDADSS